MGKRKIILSYEQMRKLARYEMTFHDLMEEEESYEDVEFTCADSYAYSSRDIVKALKTIWRKDPYLKEFQMDWYQPICELSNEFGLDSVEPKKWKTTVFQQFLRDSLDLEITDDALLNLFWNLFTFDDNNTDSLHISQMFEPLDPIKGFERLLSLKKVPVSKWDFIDSEMLGYLTLFREEDVADKAGSNKKNLAQRCIHKLLEKKDTLFIDYQDADYHILMGDLYYYGHKNHPRDYNKAFTYYSNAAASLHPEGMYKLADLFFQGKGCIEDRDRAKLLYTKSYELALKAFLNHEKSCLAQIAYRMGNLCMDETKLEVIKAYKYYLQAKCAAETLPKESDFFGNIPIHYQIAAAIERNQTLLNENKIHQETVKHNTPNYFLQLCQNNYPCQLTIGADENGLLKLTSKRMATRSVPNPEAILITIPEGSFAQRTLTISYYADEKAQLWTKEDVIYLCYDFCEWDALRKRIRFYWKDELVASVQSDCYYFKCEEQEMEYWIASAQFPNDQRAYLYICPFDVVEGDKVIVENFVGEAEVKVLNMDIMKESELSYPIEKIKTIKRVV